MPAVTVPFGLPYPLPADPTRVEADIQALAEVTDALVAGMIADAEAAARPDSAVVTGAPQPMLNNTVTAMEFNSVVWDNAGYSDLSVRPDLLTIGTSGIYIVQATVAFAPNLTGFRRLEIRDGFGVVMASHQVQTVVDPNSGTTISAHQVFLSSPGGQFLTLWAQHTAGTTLLTLGCEMSAVRVG